MPPAPIPPAPRQPWALSVLIAGHLVALTLAAIPAPATFPTPQASASAHTSVPVLSTLLDSLAHSVAVAVTALHRVAAPVEQLTSLYVRAGLSQSWIMFSDPFREDWYIRVDFIVSRRAGAGRAQVFRRLVLPAQDESGVRLTHAFVDKAILRALDSYAAMYPDLDASPASADVVGSPSGLAAVVRYERERFRAAQLDQGDTILRTEVWHGVAPIPPPGERLDEGRLRERLARLKTFQDAEFDGDAPSDAPLGTMRQDAGVSWQLIYVE